MQEELREVLAISMKEPRVQALEHVISEFNDIEVVQVPRKILARVVLEVLRIILRAQEVLMQEGALLEDPESEQGDSYIDKEAECALCHHLNLHSAGF
jgi:hypothetical protein